MIKWYSWEYCTLVNEYGDISNDVSIYSNIYRAYPLHHTTVLYPIVYYIQNVFLCMVCDAVFCTNNLNDLFHLFDFEFIPKKQHKHTKYNAMNKNSLVYRILPWVQSMRCTQPKKQHTTVIWLYLYVHIFFSLFLVCNLRMCILV